MKQKLPLYTLLLVAHFTILAIVYIGLQGSLLTQQAQSIHSNILQNVQSYERVLRNARWPAQRYEYLASTGLHGKEDILKIVRAQMLQLSFGFDHDYFLMRSASGETRVQIQQGALSTTLDDIHIRGEDRFASIVTGLYIRPCRIRKQQLLCIVDFPVRREFVPIAEQNYIIIALPLSEFLLSIKPTTIHGLELLRPLSYISLIVEDQEHALLGKRHGMEIFRQGLQIDEGIHLHAGVPVRALIIPILLIAIPLAALFLCIAWVVQRRVRGRMQVKLEQDLLKRRLEHFHEIQVLVKGVRHDIQSPLTVLHTLTKSETDPEKIMLISHVLKRMKMITKDLDIKEKFLANDGCPFLPLNTMLALFMSEKEKEYEQQYRFVFSPASSECWIKGSYSEFSRMLSNLVNNAVEASAADSEITVAVQNVSERHVEIMVKDCGKGIPPEHLTNVFQQGFTMGKKNGTGFGLSHCQQVAQNMQGQVRIASELGRGTTITLQLPIHQRPIWAIEQFDFRHCTQVVLVDDEAVYHHLWGKKLEALPLTLHYYDHPQKVPPHHFADPNAVFLFDNNFGTEYSLGLRFLQEHTVKRCIMLTAEWMLEEVQRAAEALNVGLCGKDFCNQMEVLHDT